MSPRRPKVSQDGPTYGQDPTKHPARLAKIAPRWPKYAHDGPRSLFKRRCHNNLSFTSSISHLLHISHTKMLFSSPRMAPRWPHVWPRCPQDAPQTGPDIPKTPISTPTMVNDTFSRTRCHNNLNFTSSPSLSLHTSRTKTPFTSFQGGPLDSPRLPPDGPKFGQDGSQMA